MSEKPFDLKIKFSNNEEITLENIVLPDCNTVEDCCEWFNEHQDMFGIGNKLFNKSNILTIEVDEHGYF